MKTLAEHLGVIDPRPEDKQSGVDVDELLDITDPKKFCQRLVASREFKQFLVSGIVLGDIPPAVVTRIMDHAWGKPLEQVEHTVKVPLDGLSLDELKERVVMLQNVINQLETDRPETYDEPVSQKLIH